jgi:hypothetical protein
MAQPYLSVFGGCALCRGPLCLWRVSAVHCMRLQCSQSLPGILEAVLGKLFWLVLCFLLAAVAQLSGEEAATACLAHPAFGVGKEGTAMHVPITLSLTPVTWGLGGQCESGLYNIVDVGASLAVHTITRVYVLNTSLTQGV